MRLGRVRAAGFTLVEAVVGLTLTAAVFAIALPYLAAQARGVTRDAGRINAEQAVRYAVDLIDRDLRRAGADSGQPVLVLASGRALSFNADLTSSTANDPDASESDVSLAADRTLAWDAAASQLLPGTTRRYPTVTYLGVDGARGRSETITYFLTADTVPGRTDLFVLNRQVNGRPATEVVRPLLLAAGADFFTYLQPVTQATTQLATPFTRPTPIASTRLPAFWDQPLIDSIRVVELAAVSVYRDAQSGSERQVTVRGATMIANMAVRQQVGCGAAPAAPTTVTVKRSITTTTTTTGPKNNPVTVTTTAITAWEDTVSWRASTDDGKGAKDVRGYLVERAATAAGPWEPIGSVPARTDVSYDWIQPLGYTSTASVSGKYRITAIDCGGLRSAPAVSP